MASHWRALALWMLVHCFALAADTFSYAPRDGVLVLRNGFVVSGYITPLGESYLVLFGDRGEARIPRTEVEFECGSLDEAYLLKRDSLEADDAKRHLQLADWCMRHKLMARAADQLLTARMLEPEHVDLVAMERRFDSLATLLAANADKRPQAGGGNPEKRLATDRIPVVQSSTTATTQELPPFLVQQFTVNVQPILLNRCAAHACHGMGGANDYRLVRPSLGQPPTARLTHRNLQSTLMQVNRQDPNSSPLLVMAQHPHAGFAADFEMRNANQLEAIAAWVRRLGMKLPAVAASGATKARPTAAEAFPTANATQQMLALRKRGLNPDGSPIAKPDPTRSTQSDGQAVHPAGHRQFESPSDGSAQEKPSGDPFDPAEFNRRYHSRP